MRTEDPGAVLELADSSVDAPRIRSEATILSTQSSVSIHRDIPPALRAFLDTLRTPLEGLAPIFIANGFNSDASLDILSELPPEGNWEKMKQEILVQGRLAGWLAVKHALQQRRSGTLGRG